MLKLFDSFAGYGGAHYALKKAKIKFEAVGFSENDPFASTLYELNHPGIKNFGDITKIDCMNSQILIFLLAVSMSALFSQVLEKVNKTRGTLFYDIIRLCSAKNLIISY